MDYLQKPYLPANQPHVFGGSPGAGKTTLLIQLMPQVEADFVYVCSDRTAESYLESVERIGGDVGKFRERIFSVVDELARQFEAGKLRPGQWWEWATDHILGRAKPGGLVVFDTGIVALPGVANWNDMRQVAQGMARLAGWCKAKQQTAVLVLHTNKTKRTEDFMNVFHRIAGSHALLGYAGTRAILLTPEEVPEGEARKEGAYCLRLQGQHFAEETVWLEKDEVGRFKRMASEKIRDETVWRVLALIGPDGKKIRDLLAEAEAEGIGRRAVYYALASLEAMGYVKQGSKGLYVLARR